jgi:hypothetical protein
VKFEVGRFGKSGFTAGLERGDQQTEARNSDGERVEVDAVDAVQRRCAASRCLTGVVRCQQSSRLKPPSKMPTTGGVINRTSL